ncbi:MAG: hypothetical protein QW101_03715 [Ignisphaera sp.]
MLSTNLLDVMLLLSTPLNASDIFVNMFIEIRADVVIERAIINNNNTISLM